MSKHSKAPWRVERGNFGTGRYIADAKGNPVAHMTSNGTPLGMERERSGETQANADLLASAPDLRAALIPFAKLLQAHHDGEPDDRRVFAINHAAITLGDLRRAVAALQRAGM